MAAVADFVELVGQWRELEWYRFAGGTSDEGSTTLPFVVWRYANPAMAGSDLVMRAIKARPRSVDWYCEKPGRNWVLAPRRLLDEQARRGQPTDLAAIRALAREDEEFCRITLEDFGRITDDLRALLREP